MPAATSGTSRRVGPTFGSGPNLWAPTAAVGGWGSSGNTRFVYLVNNKEGLRAPAGQFTTRMGNDKNDEKNKEEKEALKERIIAGIKAHNNHRNKYLGALP